MSDTCAVCGRYYATYGEGHTPNSTTCLQNQLSDVKGELREAKAKIEMLSRTAAGEFMQGVEHRFDLMNVPESPREYYLNIYSHGSAGHTQPSLERAQVHQRNSEPPLGRIRLVISADNTKLMSVQLI